MSNGTKSWIIKHPIQVAAPPNGYKQIQIIESTSFEEAVGYARKLRVLQLESVKKRGVNAYVNRNAFTIIELSSKSSKQDAIEAFFERKFPMRKEIL